jgi:hypothetical protein
MRDVILLVRRCRQAAENNSDTVVIRLIREIVLCTRTAVQSLFNASLDVLFTIRINV